MVGGIVVLGLVLAALIGLGADPRKDASPISCGFRPQGRVAISAATLRGAIEFLPFGSGLSTFASVFPRFQVEVFGGYIDYAHNDYLQLFMELGLAAPVIVALLLVGVRGPDDRAAAPRAGAQLHACSRSRPAWACCR